MRLTQFLAAILLLSIPLSACAQSSDTKDVQIARKKLRVGLDTAMYVTSITDTITSASTDREMPTAEAVYEYGQTLGGGGGGGGHTIRDDGTNKTQRDALNFVSTSTINTLATDDAGNNETEIALNIPANGVTATEIATGAVGTSEIADGSVSFTDIQNITTARVLGRTTAGAGSIEELSAGTGISIASGQITNTGDTDGSDDITTSTTLGGDLDGTLPNPTVVGLQGNPVSATSPGSGEVLKWNGAAWAPGTDISSGGSANYQTLRDDGADKTQRQNANFVSTSTVSAVLTDDAGNNETEVALSVPTDGITATEIAPDAVGSSEIAADAVGSSEIAADAVSSSELAATTVTAGSYGSSTQVPTFTVDADGRLTAAANTAITTGTNYQTLRDDGADKTQRQNANFVSTSTVSAVLTDDAGNNETEVALSVPTDAITATEIAPDAVGSSEIAANAVGSSEIAADAVGSSELAATTVTAGSYGSATQVPTFTVDADGRLTAAANTAITTGTNYQTLRDDGTDKTQRPNANFVSTSTVSAVLTDDAGNNETEVALSVPTDGITATEIATGAVATSELATNAVTNVKVNDVSVSKLTNGTITSGLTMTLTNSSVYRIEYPTTSNPAVLVDDVSSATSIFSEDSEQFFSADQTSSLIGSGGTYAEYIDGTLRLYDSDHTNSIGIKPPATGSLTADYTLTLPVDDGTSGQVLSTDGSGNLSWATGGGGGGYDEVQEEGTPLTARTSVNFVGSSATAADDAGNSRTNVTFDSDLNALASTASTGMYAVTGTGSSATRTITGPAAGITVTNGSGVSGNPTLALANDLSGLEGLASTGIAARTASDTWTTRTITGPAAGITVTNGSGVSGNPTLALANDLSGLEGLASTGIPARTASDTWTTRTITAGAGISVSNGDGVSGNPTITAATTTVTDYTSSGTFTVVSGMKSVEIICVGAGGGGGSGRKGAASTVRSGGGGGTSGGVSMGSFSISVLGNPASITVTVGAGGAGGISQTLNSTDGLSGSNGGETSCDVSGTKFILAEGGKGGGPGNASFGVAGVPPTDADWVCNQNAGLSHPSSGGQSVTTLSGNKPGGHGGGGGSVTSANANTGGGTGGAGYFRQCAGGAGGAAETNGTAGTAVSLDQWTGGGGGGGGSKMSAGAAAGSGGAGARGAGGGGGGGGTDSACNSGAGGAGGAGWVRIIAHY